MKKLRLSVVLVLMFVFLICSKGFSVKAESQTSKPIKVIINNTLLEFKDQGETIEPYIKDGRTLVPFRAIFETLGMEVDWENDTKTVVANNDKIRMIIPIGQKEVFVNEKKKILDVAAEITRNRTYVPLRFVGESCGAEVLWDAKTRRVNINLPQEKYDIGEMGKYKDFTFTVEKIEKTEEEGTSIIWGKTNFKNTNMIFEIYNDNMSSVISRPIIYDSESGEYQFKAYLRTFGEFVPKYLEVKFLNNEGNFIKVAEYEIQMEGIV